MSSKKYIVDFDFGFGMSSRRSYTKEQMREIERQKALGIERRVIPVWPWIIVLCIVIIVVVYLISAGASIAADMGKYKEMYYSMNNIGADSFDSKADFNKPVRYVITKKDGTTEVIVELTSDYLAKYEDEIDDIKREDSSTIEGVTGEGNGQNKTGTAVNLSATAEQVKQALSANPTYAAKADSLSMIYDVVMNVKNDENLALGFMINSAHEGNYGVVQYGHTVPRWDGSNDKKSTASNPLIVSTRQNIKALEDIAVSGNTTGVGIVQWTYYTRLQGLISHYYNQLGEYSSMDINAVATAERNWFTEEINAYYNSIVEAAEDSGYTAGTAEAYAYGVCVAYEKPSNKEQKGVERANSVAGLISALGDLVGNEEE